MLIATAGHVDHGKTLIIHKLTGVDTDRLPEEKQRGLTIDLGFAYHDLGDTRVGFVDVPGHERFIHNMLAGVGAIDYALVVVAADDGVMPQTVEHLAILELLGIQKGLVAISKTDRVDAARTRAVEVQVRNLLAGSTLRDAPLLPVSAMTGENMQRLRDTLHEAASVHGRRAVEEGFRLSIDRSFSVQGAGQVVTGAVFAGSVKEGDSLLLAPGGQSVRVRGIHANGAAASTASTGQRAALNIVTTGIRREQLARGTWLVADAAAVECERFDARLAVLAEEAKPVKHWMPVHLHLGAWTDTARIAVLGGHTIAAGEHGYVQIVPSRPLHALYGDRFVVRDQSAQRTIGGGVVIDPFAQQRGRHKPAHMETLAAHEISEPGASLAALAALADHAIPLAQFARRRNLPPDSVDTLAKSLALRRVSTEAGSVGVSAQTWSRFESRLTDAMRSFHGEHSDRVGASEADLINAAGLKSAADMARLAIRELVREGALHRDGAHLRAPGYKVILTRAEQALWDRLADILRADEAAPPVVAEISTALGLERKDIDTFLRASAQRGMLVRVAPNRYYHPGAIAKHADTVAKLAASAEKGRFTAADFRSAAGIGRNLAIQVLEHFDSTKLTRRLGDRREMVLSRRRES